MKELSVFNVPQDSFYWGSFWRKSFEEKYGKLPEGYFFEVYTEEVPTLFFCYKFECYQGFCEGGKISSWPLIFKGKEPTDEEIGSILQKVKQVLDNCEAEKEEVENNVKKLG